jgi:hypothetical protein
MSSIQVEDNLDIKLNTPLGQGSVDEKMDDTPSPLKALMAYFY